MPTPLLFQTVTFCSNSGISHPSGKSRFDFDSFEKGEPAFDIRLQFSVGSMLAPHNPQPPLRMIYPPGVLHFDRLTILPEVCKP